MTLNIFGHVLALLVVAHAAFACFVYAVLPGSMLREEYAKAAARQEFGAARVQWLFRAVLLAYATWRLW